MSEPVPIPQIPCFRSALDAECSSAAQSAALKFESLFWRRFGNMPACVDVRGLQRA